MNTSAAHAALQWYLDNGVDEAVLDEPSNRMAPSPPADPEFSLESVPTAERKNIGVLLGTNDARLEAVKLAQAAQSLEELKTAIAAFDGVALKNTATNLVFADGNPKAKVMLVGEAPGADEDRLGLPFVGVSGQLLDKILASIDLTRKESVYISNILNWRPPGNRTPAPGEIDVSLPFIERHIQLVKPDILILCGGVAAKALLGRSEGITRLRKTWHNYIPQTPELRENAPDIKAIATFHPSYLLRTPAHKREAWTDMLMLKAGIKRDNIP